MPGPRTLRGDIAEILNPLVRDGLIAGFRTNLYERQQQDEVVVMVTALEADDLDGAWHRVRQALDALSGDIVIHVDLA